MKNTRKVLGFAAIVAAIGLMFLPLTGCGTPDTPDKGTEETGGQVVDTPVDNTPVELTMGVFSEGNIPTTNGVQWFKFTTEAAQTSVYIHLLRGAMSSGKVSLYEANRTTLVGTADTTLGTTANTSRTVTPSTTYYIKVTPYTGSGKYRIGVVNSTSATPVPSIISTMPDPDTITELTTTWVDGSITYDGEEKWYKLTSTAIYQYIFADLLTIFNLNAQLYGENGLPVGSNQLFGRGTFTSDSKTVTNSTVYYIRVYTTIVNGIGTYKIASTSGTSSYSAPTAPAITVPTTGVVSMTADAWADGNITTAGGEQWFKFTAAAASYYIHLNLGSGTLNDIVFQLYTSDGKTAGSGSGSNLSSSSFSLQRTGLTNGTEYYIRVKGYTLATGTFKIGFNTTEATPVVETVPTTGVVSMTAADTWVSGNISTATGSQWFKFTSTATTQYFYFQAGGLTQIYVLLYTADGRLLGSRSNLYTGTYSSYTSRTVTNSTVYYIKVTPYSSDSGTGAYKLGFGTTTTLPTS